VAIAIALRAMVAAELSQRQFEFVRFKQLIEQVLGREVDPIP
jgi:hypothetical protein